MLWPDKVSRADLERLKVELGSYRYAAQYQQRPAPAEGGMFKRGWWRYWSPAHSHLPPVSVRMPDGEVRSIPAVPLPDRFDQVVQSWDLAFKDLATSDYVVGQVWAAVGADRFLLDQRRERMDMPRTMEAIRAMSEKWPQAAAKLVEDRANGPAVIASLQTRYCGPDRSQPGRWQDRPGRRRQPADRGWQRLPAPSGDRAVGGGANGGMHQLSECRPR